MMYTYGKAGTWWGLLMRCGTTGDINVWDPRIRPMKTGHGEEKIVDYMINKKHSRRPWSVCCIALFR